MNVFINESENMLKLRHYQNALEVLGRGVLLFGAWSVLKVTMNFLLNQTAMNFLQAQIELSGVSKATFLIIIYIVLAMDLFVRYLISKAATSEAKGKIRGNGYLIVCVILILISVYSIAAMFFQDETMYSDIFTFVVSLLVELTVVGILLGVIVESVRIKRITKAMGKEAAK